MLTSWQLWDACTDIDGQKLLKYDIAHSFILNQQLKKLQEICKKSRASDL